MTEHNKFTDEFIIKEFEHFIDCTSRDELISNNGVTQGDLLDLITRQKVEIDSLRADLNNFIKSEAIKEFAKRLKEEWFNNRYNSPDIDFDYFIDLNVARRYK